MSAGGPFAPSPELMNLIGVGAEELAEILKRLGYRREGSGDAIKFRRQRPSAGRTGRAPRRRPAKVDPHSPFAKLGDMFAEN